MKIYVNKQYEITALDNGSGLSFEVFQTREELFGNLCDACIRGYKYEPSYEFLFNEDGSNARDEKTGELLYKTDEFGNKISNGFSCYPFVDYHTLMLIQTQYEESQKKEKALTAKIEYLSMMTGVKTEVGNE
nr:hypothetical protein [uncultured Clostridium sp.]